MTENMVEVKYDKTTGEKVKRVFDRIWSTSIIVLNTVWGIVMAIFCIGALWWQAYMIKEVVPQALMSGGVLAVVNVVNYLTRKLLKNW